MISAGRSRCLVTRYHQVPFLTSPSSKVSTLCPVPASPSPVPLTGGLPGSAPRLLLDTSLDLNNELHLIVGDIACGSFFAMHPAWASDYEGTSRSLWKVPLKKISLY